MPLCALIVVKWLRARLRARRAQPIRQRASIKHAVMRVDAKAKAEGMGVAVGGWVPFHDEQGRIVVEKPRWFSVKLTEEAAPGAFTKGVPARDISALELLATTLGLVLLSPAELDATGAAGTVSVTGCPTARFPQQLCRVDCQRRGCRCTPSLSSGG